MAKKKKSNKRKKDRHEKDKLRKGKDRKAKDGEKERRSKKHKRDKKKKKSGKSKESSDGAETEAASSASQEIAASAATEKTNSVASKAVGGHRGAPLPESPDVVPSQQPAPAPTRSETKISPSGEIGITTTIERPPTEAPVAAGSAARTAARSEKPVIFLAFANDRDDTVGYLRNLPDEARRIRTRLERAEQAELCDVVVRTNSTAQDIFKVFQDPRYRNRIGVFHYGGHANGYQLLLESAGGESAAADAGGLAAFMGQQDGLQLVFLNGCSTQQQTRALLDANVSAVISTSRAIDDRVATDFSCQFYQGLAGGATIRTAYNEAEASVQTAKGGNTRGLYFGTATDSQAAATRDIWPWNLYLREGSESIDQWNLPEAVDDPLFGLPPLPQQELPESPYRHLNWFTRKDAEVFFGRGHQIRELYERLTAPRSAPIMLFYGQSGVGKSSILDAGLLPRLEQQYDVRYLRRTESGLLDTLQLAFLPEAAGLPIETAWRVKEEQTGKPLIVFLDQVEELYTRSLADLPDELDQLLTVVKATFVQSDQRPRGKLVLGFRKEWLAELEAQLIDYELPRTRVFLEPLDRRGLLEVVHGPARSERLRERFGLTVEDGLPEIIADDLLADRDSAIAPTLQILLTKMWSRATEENYDHPHFSQSVYQHLKRDGILLRDFLNQQIKAFRELYPEAVDSGLLLDIVALHTTPLGTADQRTIEQLQQQYAHLGAPLPDILQQCQDLHLLTVAASTQKESSNTTRLAHDTLAPLVREQFDVSDKPGQRARRILDNRSVDWAGDQSGTPLDEADLTVVERGASGTRTLSATEQRLLEASRDLRARLQRNRRILKMGGAAAVVLIAASIALGFSMRQQAQAKGLVETITHAGPAELVHLIDKELPNYRWWADSPLRSIASDESIANAPQRLRASLALISVDNTQVNYLKGSLLAAEPIEVDVIRKYLAPHRDRVLEDLWQAAEKPTDEQNNQLLQAASALALYDPRSERWKGVADRITDAFVHENPLRAAIWNATLDPIGQHLVPSLGKVFRNRDGKYRQSECDFATAVLEKYAAGDVETLSELILDAEPRQFVALFDELAEHGAEAITKMKRELDRRVTLPGNDDESVNSNSEAVVKRQANAAVALLRMNQTDEVWPVLKASPDPRLRSWIIHHVGLLGANPATIAERLIDEPDDSIRRALVLSLGKYEPHSISNHASLVETLFEIYRKHPDPGLHAAAEWLLRQWEQGDRITEIDKQLMLSEKRLQARNAADQQQWYVNKQGHTMVIVQGKDFMMGSPKWDPQRSESEVRRLERINHTFAIAASEVTTEQFGRFLESISDNIPNNLKDSSSANSPHVELDWYVAVRYCNWLSEQEEIPNDQWCYEPNAAGKYDEGMKIADNILQRRGYRLPTEAEWEFACRAGTSTKRHYGESQSLLQEYGWFVDNSETTARPVRQLKPNEFGLFDMLGNAYEWCNDLDTAAEVGKNSGVVDGKSARE